MGVKIAERATWLNYHHLYYFMVISNEGSISKASQKLRLGQPTLSAQLRQFEDNLGVRLFERQHRKLLLNETGKVVLEYANEIFRMGSEMLEVVHDKIPTKRIHVQIGALDSIPKHLILEISKAAMQLGNCAVSILEGKADELLRELVAHKIDLIASNFVPTLSDHSSLYSKSITSSPILICGSKKFRHLKKGFPESLQQAPFILPTWHSKVRHDLDHYFRRSSIHIDVAAETQDTSIQKLMGIDGIGLVPISQLAVQDYIKSGELIEIGRLAGVSEELFLIAATRKIENPVSSELMKSFSLKALKLG